MVHRINTAGKRRGSAVKLVRKSEDRSCNAWATMPKEFGLEHKDYRIYAHSEGVIDGSK
jgi:hypothetical protein